MNTMGLSQGFFEVSFAMRRSLLRAAAEPLKLYQSLWLQNRMKRSTKLSKWSRCTHEMFLVCLFTFVACFLSTMCRRCKKHVQSYLKALALETDPHPHRVLELWRSVEPLKVCYLPFLQQDKGWNSINLLFEKLFSETHFIIWIYRFDDGRLEFVRRCIILDDWCTSESGTKVAIYWLCFLACRAWSWNEHLLYSWEHTNFIAKWVLWKIERHSTQSLPTGTQLWDKAKGATRKWKVMLGHHPLLLQDCKHVTLRATIIPPCICSKDMHTLNKVQAPRATDICTSKSSFATWLY